MAVQASAEASIPASERATTTVVALITERTTQDIAVGALDMSVGADRATLVEDAKLAACQGIDGTCAVRLLDRRRRRALQSGGSVALSVEREYAVATSPNASVRVEDLVQAGLTRHGANVSSCTTNELSATTTVSAIGSAEGSAVDDAFTSGSTLNTQLRLRLPSIGTVVSTPIVTRPPFPPPPPPPEPPAPPAIPAPPTSPVPGAPPSPPLKVTTLSDNNSTVLFVLAFGLAVISCFTVGYTCALRRKEQKQMLVEPFASPMRGDAGSEAGELTRGRTSRVAQPEGESEERLQPEEASDAAWRTPKGPPREPSALSSNADPSTPAPMPSTGLLSGLLVDPDAAAGPLVVDASTPQDVGRAVSSLASAGHAVVAATRPSRIAPMRKPSRIAPTLGNAT